MTTTKCSSHFLLLSWQVWVVDPQCNLMHSGGGFDYEKVKASWSTVQNSPSMLTSYELEIFTTPDPVLPKWALGKLLCTFSGKHHWINSLLFFSPFQTSLLILIVVILRVFFKNIFEGKKCGKFNLFNF